MLAGLGLAAIVGVAGAAAQVYVDTTDLPRAAGTHLTLAHPASTSFITPGTVAEAGETYRKILVDAGWQQYDQLAASDPTPTRIMRFRKGVQGLSVFVIREPRHGDTSVNYTAELLVNDAVAPQAPGVPNER